MKASINVGSKFSVFELLVESYVVYFVGIGSSLVRWSISFWLSARARARFCHQR